MKVIRQNFDMSEIKFPLSIKDARPQSTIPQQAP